MSDHKDHGQPASPSANQGAQLQITIDDAVLKATYYANNVGVMFTPEEFILDFMNLFPPKGVCNSRIVMSPGHVKRLAMVLQEHVKKYEDQFKVNIQPSESPRHFGFDTNKAE